MAGANGSSGGSSGGSGGSMAMVEHASKRIRTSGIYETDEEELELLIEQVGYRV